MEIQEAKPKLKVEQTQPEVRAHLTAEEAALKAIVGQEDNEWLGLTDADIVDFSLANDPYPLPKECESRLGEFAFRYCERDPKRVQELKSLPHPFRWWVANAVNLPWLSHCCDTIDGAIHMRDQMLMFKPRWMLEKAKALNNAVDEARFNARNPDKRAGDKDGNFEYAAGDKAKITDRDITVYDEEPEGLDSGEMSLEA